jgi:hypothetical protein
MTETAPFSHQDNMGFLLPDRRYIDKQSFPELPVFDFRAVPLIQSSREQLARIYFVIQRSKGCDNIC